MAKTMKALHKIIVAIFLVLSLNLASAVIVQDVTVDGFTPGSQGQIRMEIENVLDKNVLDVTVKLDFTDTPFTPLGSSESSTDEIEDDDEEDFSFGIKASSTAVPGDYEIPYTLTYTIDDDNQTEKTKTGTIGISVSGNPILSYTLMTETPVQGEQGRISLQIVNKGFSDARFLSVRLLPNGYTLLSDEEVYIGSVDSDDFETANFDVLFQSANPNLDAIVTYKDFNNKDIVETISLPVTVYSEEKAIELGIIEKDNTALYVSIVVILLIVFFVWRSIKKRRRIKRSQRLQRER